MNKNITLKLKSLPKTPGVYLYRDRAGRVIYVGKAVNLKNRVNSYFNNQTKDSKTSELIKNIYKIDTLKTGSEFEALILESDLVKRYKPKYNIRLRDDKGYVYLKITGGEYERISIVRKIEDPEADYLGPFIDAGAVRSVLKIARKIFPYCSCSKKGDEVCLYFHLGLCVGHDPKKISATDYRKNIRGIKRIFSGNTAKLKTEFTQEMKRASDQKHFEMAALYRDKIYQLEKIEKSHFISERDLNADMALVQLQRGLDLDGIPNRIECYDISNIMGTAAVGSMVVFNGGIASPKDYRRFQIKTVKGANDFEMLAVVLGRRFSARNSKWPLPNLVILDGGKGQLSTVLKKVEIPEGVRVVALAKKREEIFSTPRFSSKAQNFKKNSNLKPTLTEINSGNFQMSNLIKGSEGYFLVQRIRDEAHRFAITYHRRLKSREMYETSLDAIPGVGPITKKRLINEFGSIASIRAAEISELSRLVPKKIAIKIKECL